MMCFIHQGRKLGELTTSNDRRVLHRVPGPMNHLVPSLPVCFADTTYVTNQTAIHVLNRKRETEDN